MSTNAQTTLARSLAIQLRVIHALLLREVITRYGRHGLGVLWIALEPMLFTLGVAGLWYLAKLHTVSDIPIIAFAITGYSSVLMWRNSTSRAVKAIEPNLSLMYHRNVKVIDVILARAVLELVGATSSFAILTFIFAILGAIRWPTNIMYVIGGWALLAWFSISLALIVGAISERSELIEKVWHIIAYLLFPLSGAVFMADWLPTPAREAVLWLPMVHCLEMVRHGFFGEIVPTYESLAYVTVANLVLSLIGLALVSETGRRVCP